MLDNVVNQDILIINQNDFEENIKRLVIYPKKAKFLVGVSGGADSLCLAFMLSNFANKINAELLAIIVDHKLREESTNEAHFVANLLKSLNIKSVIVNRNDVPIVSGIQSKAREDRYALLKSYAQNHGYPYLFIAHHLDDQIETISMRVESGENIIGSSGMSAKVVSKETIILRPFLNYTKQQIINTLKTFSDTWIEDPSNKNTKYTRVQHRFKLSSLDNASKEVLVNNYHENAKQRINLEQKVLDALSKCILINSLGLININLILFNRYEENVKILVLRKLIKFANSKTFEVKIAKVKNFLKKLELENSFKFSLGNCLLKVKKNEITIFKNRIDNSLSKITDYWDNRFIFCNPNKYEDVFINKITKEIYFERIKEKPFKEYFVKNGFDGDFIWGLPWFFDKNGTLNWDYRDYNNFKYKSKSPLLMNFFSQ